MTPIKLGGYAVVLVAVLVAGAGVGAAVGPLDDGDDAAEMTREVDTTPTTTVVTTPEEGSDMPGGLSASEAGYTFAPDDTTFTPGIAEAFTFRVLGPDGAPVTDFDTRHDRDLHLVVVSDDLSDYQHLHPALGSDGTWSTELGLPRAGGYRAYADFAAAGAEPLTLGVDLLVAGELAPEPLPAPTTTTTVDGYEVRLDGDVAAGVQSGLRFYVARDGEAVTDLEPYLGAFGHLVAIRATDHAYLHVHPTEDSSAQEVAFAVHVPSPGAHRLFLDFQHEGVVRTAAFILDVPAGTTTGAAHEEELTLVMAATDSPAPEARDQLELSLGGMTCASCAMRIEKKLNRLDGVTATVHYATEKARSPSRGRRPGPAGRSCRGRWLHRRPRRDTRRRGGGAARAGRGGPEAPAAGAAGHLGVC